MKRVQIQLTDKKLDDVVQEMADAAVRSLVGKSGDPEKIKIVHEAIRQVMEKYVHAYDSCGLAAICHEATEIDPWMEKGQDED